MKRLIEHTKLINYEGRPVFIVWDLWFEVMQLSRHQERLAPFDHFGNIVNNVVNNTGNIFYN